MQVREALTGLLTVQGLIVIQAGSLGPDGPGNPGDTADGAFLLPGRPLVAAQTARAVVVAGAEAGARTGGREEEDDGAEEGRED